MKKPEVMNVDRKWCQTKCGQMHFIINTDPKTGNLCGVQIQIAKSRVCANTQAIAHTNMINLCIDQGVPLERIVEKMRGNGCEGARDGLSCPDAIAEKLSEYVKSK